MNLPIIDLRTQNYGLLLPNSSNDIDVDLNRLCASFEIIDSALSSVTKSFEDMVSNTASTLQMFYKGMWFSFPRQYLNWTSSSGGYPMNSDLLGTLRIPPAGPDFYLEFTEETARLISGAGGNRSNYYFILHNESNNVVKIQKIKDADLDDEQQTAFVAPKESVLVSSLDGVSLLVEKTNLISPYVKSNITSKYSLQEILESNNFGVYDWSTDSNMVARYLNVLNQYAFMYSKYWQQLDIPDINTGTTDSFTGIGLYKDLLGDDSNLIDLRVLKLYANSLLVGQSSSDFLKVKATIYQYGVFNSYNLIDATKNKNSSNVSPDIKVNYLNVLKGLTVNSAEGMPGLSTGKLKLTNVQSSISNLTAGNSNISFNDNIYISNYRNSDDSKYRVVIHGNSGNKLDLEANKFQGVAVLSQYGDLAEQYKVNKSLIPGTVLTLCTCSCDDEMKPTNSKWNYVSGVISTNPGVVINNKIGSQKSKYKDIALIGRVPVRVFGKVKKGWFISPSFIEGVARATRFKRFNSFGRALENKEEKEIKQVECFISI